VTNDHIQSLVKAKVEAGYSIQTAKHIRNAVSAVFTYAKLKKEFHSDNPVVGVRSPEMVQKMVQALTFDQARLLLASFTRITSGNGAVVPYHSHEHCGDSSAALEMGESNRYKHYRRGGDLAATLCSRSWELLPWCVRFSQSPSTTEEPSVSFLRG
jgi:hypothetical protein